MPRRAKIGNPLILAWERTIQNDYCAGDVNSERSLQALLFANLSAGFEEEGVGRRVFIEPTVGLSCARDVENNAVMLRRPRHKAREGWAEESKALAESGDELVMLA